MKSHTAKNDWIPSAILRFTQMNRQHFGPDYARQEVEITKRYGCNTLAFFLEMDGWLLYPSQYAEMEETLGGVDLLSEIAAECQKAGIRLIACWMGAHCQTFHLRRNPEWGIRHYREVFPDNPFPKGSECEGKFILCLNSPYREVLLGEVAEVLERYSVDGIYFDGIYHVAGYCYCDHCQALFRQRYGTAIPTDLNNPQWAEFSRDYTLDFSREVKQLLDRLSPQAKLFQDCHGTIIGTYDSRENIRGCSKYVDSFVLESYHECSGELPTFVAMESLLTRAESGKTVSHARWLMRNPGHTHTANSESMALIWAFDAVATGGAPLLCDQEGFWYDRTLEKPMGDFMRRRGEWDEVLVNTEPLKHVALFYSLACKDQRMPGDLRAARAYFEGYYLALEQHHIPFDLVTENDILQGRLDGYAALVLPNIEFMADAVARRIQAFAAAGGGIVATYCTSFADADGKPRAKPALADLLGIAKVKGIVTRGITMATVKYDSVSLTEPATCFEITADHPLARGLLRDNLYSFAGTMADIIAAPGMVPLARTRNYDQAMANSGRFFRYVPADWGPHLLFVAEAASRTVYFAGALDRAFWEFGYNEAGTLLAQAVTWAARRPAPVEVEASPLLVARVRRHREKDCLSIHLVNYAVNQTSIPGFPGAFLAHPQDLGRRPKIHHVAPQANVKIRVATNGQAYKCSSFTGQNLTCIARDRQLEITVPVIKEGEIVLLEKKNG